MYIYAPTPEEHTIRVSEGVTHKQTSSKMDSIFNLDETERPSLLQQMIGSFGCTYVCLWSHFPHPSNYLFFIDGVYKEESNQASSSSGSLAMKSFLDYQKSIFLIDNYNGGVPGFAFMNNLPYMEFKGLELLRMASTEPQLQFYQEARIKTAIFMGCKNGEIELGTSNDSSEINLEMELKKLFPKDFHQQELVEAPLLQAPDQTRNSSSSSSLRSLSVDNSSEYSPFLFNMLQTTNYMPEIFAHDQQTPNQTPSSSTMRSHDPLEHALNQIRSTQLIHSRQNEEATMTKAILVAISSSSSPPSSSARFQTPRDASAFNRYRLRPSTQRIQSRQNIIRRSLSFFRNLSMARAQQDQMIQTTRPTTNQLHHMISERKRREKLNESFQALRSLLPPESKKDKASVLSNTKQYLISLKSQVDELNKRNKILEAQLSHKQPLNKDVDVFSNDRLTIRITDCDESTSESRVVDLEVNARGDSIVMDLMTRVLEFLKQVENVTITSVDARTHMLQTDAYLNRVVLRLRIQGGEWDQSSFQEALSRVLGDLA